MTNASDSTQHETMVEAVARGEMADLVRAYDWSRSPLGTVEDWSPSLRTMVTVLLANRFPLLLMWGSDLCQIYNDAFMPILGAKHPRALGQTAHECWAEIWDVIEPMLMTPFRGGPPTWQDDLLVEIRRHGFVEETHFTFAYSPVPDDMEPGSVGGVLATVHEITQQVVQERRLSLLRDLSARSADAKTADEACVIAAAVLENHAKDVPFALLYLADAGGETAQFTSTAGITVSETAASSWPLAEVLQSEQAVVVGNLAERLHPVPPGPWSDPPERAIVLPIPSSTVHHPAGVLVLGISPRLALDDSYHSFASLVAGHIGTAIVNARAYEEERRRAEALAELDRAKTAFFSNVSHEFRTPLTLLLGPLEEVLALPPESPIELGRSALESAHRNSLRLLRLVNTLLNFSRIEAGRAEAAFEPTDLPALTADLASTFRSAVQRAGLRLDVDCSPLPEPVYVDREMWEKIVLNLLSNALKFTFDGEIAVSVQQTGASVTLTVRDTGTGIPPDDLPHIFERFHRVRTARARTHEGTGIGLSLVQELVGLHSGMIHVESEVGIGTTIAISVPLGTAHLSPDRIAAARPLASTASVAEPYIEEALRWLPDGANSSDPAGAPAGVRATAAPTARLLIADDNADMRAYLRRLLTPRYKVEVVASGDEALAALRSHPPDLVLTDVMMPGLDGIELLQAIRSDARTRTLPVILLSARAGEEATAAGLRAGADDYLIKPFSADELLARVQAHVALSQIRRGSLEAERKSQGYLARLHHATAALSAAATVEDVAEVILQDGIEALDARIGTVAVLSDDGATFTTVRSVGYPPELATIWSSYPADTSTPITDSVRARELLILHSMAERQARYPHLADVQPLSGDGVVVSIPLLLDSRPIGALGLVFGAGREFTDDDLGIMRSLGELCAQALERARLYEAESRARREAEARKSFLEQLERAREEFLSSAAHDLRTPLTSVRGHAQLAQRRIKRLAKIPDLAPILSDLDQVVSGTDAVLGLITDLLDMTQLEMGTNLDLRRAPTDLVALVSNTILAQQTTASILIDLDAPPKLTAEVDPIRISRVVANLLSNAVKFSPDRAQPITVRLAQEVPDAIIAVTDRGIGIPAVDLPRIFDRFVRGRNVTGRIQGTGIGLASVRGIVEQHGGTISVESVEGQGTTFTVRLPITAP